MKFLKAKLGSRWWVVVRTIVGLAVVSWCGYIMLHALGMPQDAWAPNTAVFVFAYLTLLGVHEFGHLTAGVALEMRLERLAFIGVGFLVGIGGEDGRKRSNHDQLLISIAGPLLGAVASVAVMQAAGRLIPLWLAGVIGVGESVSNLAIWHHGFDGGKAWRAGIAIAKGHGDQEFIPKEPRPRKAKPVETPEPIPATEALA